MKRLAYLAIVLATSFVCSAGAQDEHKVRTWRDSTGQYEIVARLIESKDGVVTLLDREGQEIQVEIEKLSQRDQKYLEELGSAPPVSPLGKGGDGADTNAKAGEWPTWRGPNRDGISRETGLLKQWPDSGPPLLWNGDGVGGGYASVSVADGKLFTMGRENGTDSIVSLDADSGSVLWKCPVGPGSNEQGPNCTPTIDGDRVYGISLDGDLVCASVKDGKEIWRRSFKSDFGGRMMSQWGYSESPLIDGNRLLCTPGGSQAMMVALNKMNGEVIWTTPMPDGGDRGQDGAGYSSIVISHGAGVKQYIQLVGRGLISVSEDGEVLWGYAKIANPTANVPTPIVKGDHVFCSSGYNEGGTALLEIGKVGQRVGVREIYYLPGTRTQNHHGQMILIDDHVYMGNGHNKGFPLCLKFSNGQDAWRPGRGVGTGSAAIAAADGHLYFRYQNGVMALIEATPEEYRLKGSFQLPIVIRESWPQPVIAGGKMYIRDQERMMCFDLRE